MQAVTDKRLDERRVDKDAPAKAESQRSHFVTRGHRVHNEITYRGVDWLLNSTIGVSMAYWMDRTKPGKKVSEKLTNGFKSLLKPLLTDIKPAFDKPSPLEHGAKWGVMLLSIMAGGTAITPIMVALENPKNKRKIVQWIDEKIYGKDTVANDPKFAESYNEIDKEPRKGFVTGMAARAFALLPIIYVTVINKKAGEWLTKNAYDHIGAGTQFVAEKLGLKAIKTAGKGFLPDGTIGSKAVRKGEAIPSEKLSNWDFLHRMIGFDFGLTVIYAVLHEMAYKGLASAFAHRKHKTQAVESAAPNASSMQPSVRADTDSPLNREIVKETTWTQKSMAAKSKMERAGNYVKAVDASRANAAEQHALS